MGVNIYGWIKTSHIQGIVAKTTLFTMPKDLLCFFKVLGAIKDPQKQSFKI